MSYKKRPELLDVIRRRGVSFHQWCSEFGIKTWDDVVTKCREQDVIAPDPELGKPLTTLPIVGFSETAKAQVKEFVDAVHDEAEKVPHFPPVDALAGLREPEPEAASKPKRKKKSEESE